MRTVHYDHFKKSKDVIMFLSVPPHKIKVELSMKIHEQMHLTIKFFKNKEQSLIAIIPTENGSWQLSTSSILLSVETITRNNVFNMLVAY